MRGQRSLAHCAQATVGLAFMPKRSSDINMVAMTGASNKPFDYMACGLGLIVSDLPEWRTMFVKPGHAVACDPEVPASIARAIAWFVEHPREAAEMRARGRLKIMAEWNYEAQFEPVLGLMEA
jgi:spore maturation protein CgeB